jgi:hypothetical protein
MKLTTLIGYYARNRFWTAHWHICRLAHRLSQIVHHLRMRFPKYRQAHFAAMEMAKQHHFTSPKCFNGRRDFYDDSFDAARTAAAGIAVERALSKTGL